MTPKPVDRRVRKTRSLLQHTMQDLILEKGYDAITVQNILDRADVARATFYAHFRDKDHLLLSGFEVLHAEMDEAMASEGGGSPPSLSDIALGIFRHAQTNRRGFQAMMGGASGEIVIRAARNYLAIHVRDEIGPRASRVQNPAIVDAIVDFEAGALVSLISWWLDTESTLSAEEMQALYVTLTHPGLDAALA